MFVCGTLLRSVAGSGLGSEVPLAYPVIGLSYS